MDYDQIQIGKITKYNAETQIGEVVSKMGPFLFIKSDIIDDEDIEINDIVQFRGEQVLDTNRAFFVKKYKPVKENDYTAYVKTYKGINEGNEK